MHRRIGSLEWEFADDRVSRSAVGAARKGITPAAVAWVRYLGQAAWADVEIVGNLGANGALILRGNNLELRPSDYSDRVDLNAIDPGFRRWVLVQYGN
jgi:hypothetical protein